MANIQEMRAMFRVKKQLVNRSATLGEIPAHRLHFNHSWCQIVEIALKRTDAVYIRKACAWKEKALIAAHLQIAVRLAL